MGEVLALENARNEIQFSFIIGWDKSKGLTSRCVFIPEGRVWKFSQTVGPRKTPVAKQLEENDGWWIAHRSVAGMKNRWQIENSFHASLTATWVSRRRRYSPTPIWLKNYTFNRFDVTPKRVIKPLTCRSEFPYLILGIQKLCRRFVILDLRPIKRKLRKILQ